MSERRVSTVASSPNQSAAVIWGRRGGGSDSTTPHPHANPCITATAQTEYYSVKSPTVKIEQIQTATRPIE